VGSQIEQVTAEITQPGFDPHQADLNWQQIERQVKLVELKMIKVRDNSSHYQLEYQDFDQAGEYSFHVARQDSRRGVATGVGAPRTRAGAFKGISCASGNSTISDNAI